MPLHVESESDIWKYTTGDVRHKTITVACKLYDRLWNVVRYRRLCSQMNDTIEIAIESRMM